MGALFAPRQRIDAMPQNSTLYQNQNAQDPTDYVQEMLARSGGDAKAAFYLGCQEKGVNPDLIIQQAQLVQNPKQALRNMAMSNPKMQGLMALLSAVK